jgi:NAD(P)-dependent dehydrogenase (short-subunit alcohol dehydrogenase family)
MPFIPGEEPVMLIAGGTGSIGSEIAAQAIRAGWIVALHGRSEASVQAARQRLNNLAIASQLIGIAADIRESGTIEWLVAQAAARCGRIDAVIDCIATGPPGTAGPFADMSPDAFLELMRLSIVNLQRLAHAALPWLRKRGGCLIAFASDAGVFAAPHQVLIGAARTAVVGFVRNLALELAVEKIRVHCIAPSYVEGSAIVQRLAARSASRLQTARRRAGLGLPTAADIAPLVLFLCSDQAGRITGQTISVNGGLNA